MKKVRIHKDITVRWRVKTNGSATALSGRTLELLITDTVGNTVKVQSFVISDTNRISFVWPGKDQTTTGRYTLTLVENAGSEGSTCLDAVDFVELVRRTSQEGGSDVEGLDQETVDLEGDLIYNGRGLSAYEVWLANGHTGTEAEFLESLKGQPFTVTVSEGLLDFAGDPVSVEGTTLII